MAIQKFILWWIEPSQNPQITQITGLVCKKMKVAGREEDTETGDKVIGFEFSFDAN